MSDTPIVTIADDLAEDTTKENAPKAPRPDLPAGDGEFSEERDEAKADRAISEAAYGEDVQDDPEVPRHVWVDPMDAFLADGPDNFAALVEEDMWVERPNGDRILLRLRGLMTPTYEKIIQHHTSYRKDKKTGAVTQVTRDREVMVALILEGVTNIDFNSDKLKKKFKLEDPYALVERMFLHGWIERIAARIAALSGYNATAQEEEAGN